MHGSASSSKDSSAVRARLFALLEHRFDKPSGSLGLEDDVASTLAIDSYRALELLSELEAAFSIEVPDYELRDVRTFADLAGLVERRL